MANRKQKAQSELRYNKRTRIVILRINSNRLKDKLEGLAQLDHDQPQDVMSADPSQGAFSGTRSKSAGQATQGTPTRNPLFNYKTLSDTRAVASTTPKTTRPKAVPNTRGRKPQLSFKDEPDVVFYERLTPEPDEYLSKPLQDDTSSGPESSADDDFPSFDSNDPEPTMSTDGKPKLKLSFSKANLASRSSPAQTPAAQTANRTTSIKLKLKPEPASLTQSSVTTPAPRSKKTSTVANGKTPSSSAKKRKQPDDGHDSSEDELSKRPQPLRKMTLSQPKPDLPKPPIVRPIIKLKHKGKIPKRPLGVGYDSELSDTEKDPTIIEAFMLRMLPGPDCDYLRESIERGLVGLHRSQDGADVQMMPLDHHGRRFMVTVRQHRYAATMVDLPCIVEGMKSWDKKAFIKSADICQLLLVLGHVGSVEEAKVYPLPPEVEPKTFQYAHGLTPPMRWVRKRRFARTRRHDPHDIERVERQVQQLLADDAAAFSSSYSWYNPQDDDEESAEASEEEDEDEDAEGEDVGDYLGEQNGMQQIVETPALAETPVSVEEDDATAQFEALMEADEEEDAAQFNKHTITNNNTLHPPENDSFFAVTSTSASASATAAQTPATVNGDAASSEDEDGDLEDDDEVETPASIDDNTQGMNARIQELQEKIDDSKAAVETQRETLKQHSNQILQRRINEKIGKFKADIENYRRQIREEGGVVEDDDDDDDDE